METERIGCEARANQAKTWERNCETGRAGKNQKNKKPKQQKTKKTRLHTPRGGGQM